MRWGEMGRKSKNPHFLPKTFFHLLITDRKNKSSEIKEEIKQGKNEKTDSPVGSENASKTKLPISKRKNNDNPDAN